MLDDRFEREVVDAPPDPRRYPTGVLMLIGMLAGAGGGVAIGMAIGAGLDAVLNRWLNGEHGM